MENNKAVSETVFSQIRERITRIVSSDRYKYVLMACLWVGILLGCVTRSVYGGAEDWRGLVEGYCKNSFTAFICVAPVTLGFLVFLFALAPFYYSRLLIYPLSAIRGMGFGALICGAVQRGGLMELCFASLVLLPFCAANCVIAVYAGEYALGFRPSRNGWNEGLSKKLNMHAVKMMTFYLVIAGMTCGVFAASCFLFGQFLI